MYCLWVLEPRNLKSECQQGHSPSEGARELSASDLLPGPPDLFSITPVFTWLSPCMHVFVHNSPFYKDTHHALGTHSISV